MQEKSSVSGAIDVAAQRAKYDEACKRLLSEKVLLAPILKECVEEFRFSDVKDIAEKYIEGDPEVSTIPVHRDMLPEIMGTGVEDNTISEGTVVYDIRFKAIVPDTDKKICLYINVEAQNRFSQQYPLLKRAIYYCSRLISAQYGTEFIRSDYGNIKKVYSIWICSRPPKEIRNTITVYGIVEGHQIGNAVMPREDYDLMQIVLVCLDDENKAVKDSILRMLSVLLSEKLAAQQKKHILEDEYAIPMTQSIDTEVNRVCDLSYGVYSAGMEKGSEYMLLKNIRSLMETLQLPATKVMEALKIPASDWPKYQELLKA